MDDPILEELWRVREKLVKEHGGLDGYFQHVQELDLALQVNKAKKTKKTQKARLGSKRLKERPSHE